MNDVVIRAEGLGKKYIIGHQPAKRERYVALRDVMVRNIRALGRSAVDIARGRPNIAGDELEEFWALRGVDFEIRRGEVVGIVGRNGAGKSTLLKVLSRITEPTAGRVTICGRVASLLEVGTGFHPELTGRENVYVNGAILGMSRLEIDRKFDEIIEFSGVEKFLDTPVKRYSSGMYVRLAFSVAAHLEPDILIVDEVLAVGDADFQKKCIGKMNDVAHRGRTVLLVSHNMTAIRSLCQRGIMLSRDEPVRTGSIDEIVEVYLRQSHSVGKFTPNAARVSHFTVCQLNNAEGKPAAAPFTNEELTVRLTYTNTRNIRGLRVGFSISSSDGTILTVCTPEDEGVVTPDAVGSYQVVARFPKNVLMKGVHQLNAALWNGLDGEIYDYQAAVIQFQMEASRERAYAVESSRAGVFQVPIDWTIES